MQVRIKKMSPLIGDTIPLPFYATPGSAGMDLSACIEEPIVIPPGGRARVPTGIAIQLPSCDYVALVYPRSGLATRHGITMANSVGVIDSDYTGEIICVLLNQSDQEYTVNQGERIGQLLITPVLQANWQVVDELEKTERGSGGFGSTGK
ncbi:deoxyuridine 5'-triphosphate nucleotidohydrolase [Effusibacillus lacus]|uniref:Deoxyuridine 5'-triphosphate nucleotidohydrolase n=1 Tax=Effusibacillus lacus TaxID=1348429 RepID=A0A292YNU2_9BACL|nr:deoxyuridine 5'-triphosphate nucleotidohydrolase [Effusibacillus lacus]